MLIDQLLELVSAKNPLHAKKLMKHPFFKDQAYREWAGTFLGRYQNFLVQRGLSWEQAADFYLQVVNDTLYEQIQFFRNGEYSCKSFEDANEKVYSKPEVMEYYMNGLLLTQVLWHHHYQVFQYFIKTMNERVGQVNRYLEVGGGHGAYTAEAVRLLGPDCSYQVVDISPTSLKMAKELIGSPKVDFKLQDVYEYEDSEGFDQLVLGEVLEHVETPSELLLALAKLARPESRLFMTTPINAPAIDHISLFKSPKHLREVITEGGWTVEHELVLPTEDLPLEIVLEKKIPIMYASQLRLKA